MIEIRVEHVAGVERALALSRDPRTDLDTLADHVRRVEPLAERVARGARARTRRPVRSLREAVVMLGCRGVEEACRELLLMWLHALERPGGARVVEPPAAEAPDRADPFEDRRPLARAG